MRRALFQRRLRFRGVLRARTRLPPPGTTADLRSVRFSARPRPAGLRRVLPAVRSVPWRKCRRLPSWLRSRSCFESDRHVWDGRWVPFPKGTRTEPRKGTDSLSKGERTGWERERSSGRVSLRDAIPKGDWGSETDRTGMDPPGQPEWVEKGEKERDASGRGGGQAPRPRWTKVQAKEGVEDGQRSQGSCRYPRAVRGDA